MIRKYVIYLIATQKMIYICLFCYNTKNNVGASSSNVAYKTTELKTAKQNQYS